MKQEEYKIDPKEDSVFKRLFGSVGSEKILKGLLESILDIKINSVELNLKQEFFSQDVKDGRKAVLDVIAKLEDQTQINVEMQTDVTTNLGKKILYYWSLMYSNQAEKGDKEFESLHKTVGIWIIDGGSMGLSSKDYHTVLRPRDQNNEICSRMNDFEIHFLELPKLRKYGTISPRKLDFWMWFLDHTNEEMIRMGERSVEEIREAVKKLRELAADPIVRQLAIQEQIAEMEDNEKKAEEAARKKELDEKEAEIKNKEAEVKKKEAEVKKQEEEVTERMKKLEEEYVKKQEELDKLIQEEKNKSLRKKQLKRNVTIKLQSNYKNKVACNQRVNEI